MRKIFTFLFAALMSVGMFATTVVTITDSDFPASESSLTKDGVTISALAIDGMQGNISGPGSFSTTLGNFTKIEVSAASISVSGEGWSGDSERQTWTGNASSVSFIGDINGYEEGTTLKFTIEPAPAKEWVVFGVNVPANGKPESIELVGSFMEDGWNNGIVLTVSETGWYTSFDVYANADDEFKIRAAGTWDNEIYVRTETGWTATQNVKIGDVWVDDTYKGTPCKWVELDLSGDNYGWKTAVQSIENIELTEQAQKMVVDGVIYIVRDGKMFNAQGAQVR